MSIWTAQPAAAHALRAIDDHPYVMAIDDDPNVLRAVARDLRKHYADRFRIITASSGQTALETAAELTSRQDDIALFLADQRMPGMSGIELLEHVYKEYPESVRVLLTAYADMDATIQAINKARVDYYLTKPWDPPDQQLYPYLDELLGTWLQTHKHRCGGIRIIGHRYSPQSHQLRDFLGRRVIPYQWIDVENPYHNGNGKLVQQLIDQQTPLPVVVLGDGTRLVSPSIQELAERLGMPTQARTTSYDLVIVGAGPAGLAAAVYGASEGLSTLMVEAEAPGGQAGTSSRIENYLGFPAGLSGSDLARRAVAQAEKFQVEILSPKTVVALKTENNYRRIELDDGTEITSRSVLIATGLEWRTLDVPGIDRLQGAGVYYGATLSEAISCQGEDVYVVGGANSAGQAALHFANYARSVTMLVRGDSLSATMSYYLIQQIDQNPTIKVQTHTEVVAVSGTSQLEGMTLRHNDRGQTSEVRTRSLFIFIGAVPCTTWLKGIVPLDEWGYVVSGPALSEAQCGEFGGRRPSLFETGVPGVFVAGDVRQGSVKRVASAVGEGSVCVQLIHQYLGLGH